MAVVNGQIESLTRIRETLNQHRIFRFNSLREINEFINSFDQEVLKVKRMTESVWLTEIEELQNICKKLEESIKIVIKKYNLKLDIRHNKLISTLNEIKLNSSKNVLVLGYNFLRVRYYKFRYMDLLNNIDSIVQNDTRKYRSKLEITKKQIQENKVNKEKIISEKSFAPIQELIRIKEIIESINSLIAGAVGENLVAKELEKLPDKFYLINDFSLKFNPPIYDSNNGDRILSIQIDHLLITNAGIFVIETKNWSQKSIERLDLRSPVNQIKRVSYALYVILNDKDSVQMLGLKKHHWGDKKVRIRNVIAMINNKPKEEFKYVTIKTLYELNDYILFFDNSFNDEEVQNIANYLMGLNTNNLN